MKRRRQETGEDLRRPRDSQSIEDVRALYAAHAGALFAFALRAVGDRQAAEEIVQDTFVRAWKAADRFDPDRGDVRPWLFVIARNLAIDHRRRNGVRPETPLPEYELDTPVAPRDLDTVLETWQIAEALDQLSPAHRDAITEVYLRGGSLAQAAEDLGVPAGTVKSRLYYGLRNLRLILEEMGVLR